MKKLILILAMLGSSAHAQFITGNELYTRMQDTGSQHHRSFTMGYITGVHDAYDGFLFCLNGNVTIGQIRDVTYAWLAANPQFRDKPGSFSVVNALREIWPCKTSK